MEKFSLKKLREVAVKEMYCVISFTAIEDFDTEVDVKSVQETIREKNAAFWDVTLLGSCKNRRFGGTQRLHHQGDKNR
jgi:hypothetical protein